MLGPGISKSYKLIDAVGPRTFVLFGRVATSILLITVPFYAALFGDSPR